MGEPMIAVSVRDECDIYLAFFDIDTVGYGQKVDFVQEISRVF